MITWGRARRCQQSSSKPLDIHLQRSTVCLSKSTLNKVFGQLKLFGTIFSWVNDIISVIWSISITDLICYFAQSQKVVHDHWSGQYLILLSFYFARHLLEMERVAEVCWHPNLSHLGLFNHKIFSLGFWLSNHKACLFFKSQDFLESFWLLNQKIFHWLSIIRIVADLTNFFACWQSDMEQCSRYVHAGILCSNGLLAVAKSCQKLQKCSTHSESRYCETGLRRLSGDFLVGL